MAIPKEIIEEIRFRCNIVDVIKSYVPDLQRRGNTHKCCCPFHQEKTPSFTVNEDKQIYHCFGCGTGGDIFRFIMDFDKVDFVSAVQILGDRAGVDVIFEGSNLGSKGAKDTLLNLHKEAASYFHRILLNGKNIKEVNEYLDNRDLSKETIRDFQIGFASNDWDGLLLGATKKGYKIDDLVSAGLVIQTNKGGKKREYDRFRKRLMFPICDHMGHVIGFSGRVISNTEKTAKYVNSPETLIFRKSRVLFAFDKARKSIIESRQAIIVEGQIDAIRCHQEGLTNVVASQGTALTEQHVKLVKRYTDEVVLVFDSDEAGIKAALSASELFVIKELSVRIATLPEKEDPDSLVKKHGIDRLKYIIEQAPSALRYLIDVERAKEDQTSEVGKKRVRDKAKIFISKSPLASDRADMINTASEILGIEVEDLVIDIKKLINPKLQQIQKDKEKESVKDGSQKNEVSQDNDKKLEKTEKILLEMVFSYYERVIDIAKDYLREFCFKNKTYKELFSQLLKSSPEEITSSINEYSKELRSLITEYLNKEKKFKSNDPKSELKQYILVLWEAEIRNWMNENSDEKVKEEIRKSLRFFQIGQTQDWSRGVKMINKRLDEIEQND